MSDWGNDVSRAYQFYSGERDADYAASQDARKYAYETAMGMIGMGLMPDDQMLSNAGLSRENAQKMVDSYLAQQAAALAASSGGGGGGRRSGGGGGKKSSKQYTSGFQQATGSYRNSNVGTTFSSGQYANFQRQVGMSRSAAGRAALIDDAVNEGKITGAQASETLKKFGISESEFDRLRGYK